MLELGYPLLSQVWKLIAKKGRGEKEKDEAPPSDLVQGYGRLLSGDELSYPNGLLMAPLDHVGNV